MAVKKARGVVRPKRAGQEPPNPYDGGGISGGQAPQSSTPRGERSQPSRNQPLSLTDDYFQGVPSGRRAIGGPPRSERSQASIQDRPGYFKYYLDDVNAPLIAGRGNPGLIAELQRRLAAAGLLESRVPRGVWDPTTQNAYQRLLEIANVWEVTDQEALNMLLAESEGVVIEESAGTIGRRSSDGSGEGGRGQGFRLENGQFVPEGPEAFVPPALEIRQPNPDEVSQVVRRASIDLLGQSLGPEGVSAITNAYIGEVTRLQREAQQRMIERERQLWETGTTDIAEITEVEAPSAEAFAQRDLENRPEAQTNKGLQLLMGALGMWGR